MTPDMLVDPQTWILLVTLSSIEIVLGIDNLVFISIAVSKLPHAQRERARRFGIGAACLTRVALLLTLAYLAHMKDDLFQVFGHGFSIRDLVLLLGGIFLVFKGTMEIRDQVLGEGDSDDVHTRPANSFFAVIAQIAVIDIVFSLDSVITAIGMVNHIGVMIAAIMVAVAVMMFASNIIGDFIDRHPTIKMLALAFIILVGVALIADGFEIHIERKLLYFAMAFSAGVESLNILAKKRQRRHRD